MTVRELYSAFCERIPATLSEEWDNDGIMCCPDPEKDVSRVLFTLDVTDATVTRAIETGAELIVSHHPLIFTPLSAVHTENPVAARVVRLLSVGISVFSFHTRFDRVEGGINDVLAKTLRLSETSPLGEGEASLGRIGTLPFEMSAEEFAEYVKIALGAPAVQVRDASRPVHRVAIVGGEGKDLLDAAISAGADTYLSGRLGYHTMQDAPINLLEAGHYYTERMGAWALADLAEEIAPSLEKEIYTPNPLVFY